MTDYSFGQPEGAIMQMAYTVADIRAGMEEYGNRLKVGPWFVMGPFTPPGALYRGAKCEFVVTLAFAFAGHIQIELLCQHNDAPSALKEKPLGFHHWGVGVSDFDARLAAYHAQGHATVFTDQAPDGGRFAYVDTSNVLGGMIELIEMNPARDAHFAMQYQAAIGWDGTDPVRWPPMPPMP